jgi:glycosyltransferase involved in cell wall biosynthesis
MESLKILIFNWRCWLNPEMGGAEIFTREVAKRWARWGHEVTLFTSKFLGCRETEEVNGVRIFRDGGKLAVYFKAKQHYKKRFAKEGFDVVVDEINTRPFMTPKFAKNGEKVVGLIHQLAREYWFYETPFPLNYFGYYILEGLWLKNYRSVPTVTVSESTRVDLINMGFEDVSVVGEGLNFKPIKRVDEKHSPPIIVFVGRLKKAKRPDHALEAFKIVKGKIPNAELWIIGDGYFKKRLMQKAYGGVKFFNQISDEERRKIIKKGWVLINPSVREGFGLNVIEANALGVPCVAYNVAGLRDSVVHGETGLLVEAGNVEALAEAVIKILEDEKFRLKLSEKALAYSKRFSWDEVAEKFMNVLRHC